MAQMHQDHEELKKIIEDVIDAKLKPFMPMLDLYNQATGFTSLTITIMKSVLLFSAVIGAIYAFIIWIRH